MIAAAVVTAAAVVNKTEQMPAGSRGAVLRRSMLGLIFLILVIPAVLRQETGNDYLRYVEFFHLASIDAYVPTESGFNALVKLLYGLCGYENYLLVFAVFAILTILLMLTAIRQQAENFGFSFFLFMMFGYYFQSFNTMRYYFALSLAMTAMTFLLHRRYTGFAAMILLASLFHKSALAALVLYPLTLHRWRKWEKAAAVLAGGLVLLFHEKALELLLVLYPSWEGTGDLAAGTSVSWVNIARCAAVLGLAFLARREAGSSAAGNPEKESLPSENAGQEGKEHHAESLCGTADRENAVFRNRQLRICDNATFLALLLYVFGWFIPEVSRICYYLTFTQIFYIPMLLRRLADTEKEKKTARVLTLLTILAALVFFALFLRTAYRDTIKILPYKSFLFHDLNRTPSASVGGMQ